VIRKKTRYRLPWPLEDTDTAVYRHLSDLKDLTNDQLTFQRGTALQSSVVYELYYPECYPDANSLGKFELFKRPDGDTEIEITGPPKPPARRFNKEEEEILDAIPPGGEEYRKQVARLAFGIDQERKDVHRRRIDLQESCINQLFARLKWESALPEWEPQSTDEMTDDAEGAEQPKTEPQTSTEDTADKQQEYPSQLLEILDQRFDEGELKTLCFYLDVDYDNLPDKGKANKARELIKYLERRNRIPELVRVGKQLRPDISWPEVVGGEVEEQEATSPHDVGSGAGESKPASLRRQSADTTHPQGQTINVYGDYVEGDKHTGVDQRGQEVLGPQTNVAGDMSGPMASGQFESAAVVGSGEAVDQRRTVENSRAAQPLEELERPLQRAEGDVSEATRENLSTSEGTPSERAPASEHFACIGSVTGLVHTGSGNIIYSTSPQEETHPAPQLPNLALKLFLMGRDRTHRDKIVFSQEGGSFALSHAFGLAMENTTRGTTAKGIGITVKFYWRGDPPRGIPHFQAPPRLEEWTTRVSQLVNEQEAVLVFKDNELICFYGQPEEWDGFKLTLSERMGGYFLVRYTISSVEPYTENSGQLRITLV